MTMKRGEGPHLSFKAFLSHRYKSPDVNLYFFRLFAETAEVQFEVDEGTSFTSVTRLERMIRGADAFIGIYPFPGPAGEMPSAGKLWDASKYFRLELDLAIRSRRPAVVFYDERYGELVKPPVGMMSRTFNAQEVEGHGGYPQADLHRRIFRNFCEVVGARKAYDVARAEVEHDATAVIVPTGTGLYGRAHVTAIQETLQACGCNDVRVLSWPPVLDRQTFSSLQESAIACVDIGAETAATGIPAYLHGSFIPSVRMKKAGGDGEASALERTLYGAVEVGYPKDILAWKDGRELRAGLKQRVLRIKEGVKRISTADDAEKYFRSAALRKEAVFLSYSGKDQEVAARVTAALKLKFQEVFNYRDGESIRPGEPWLSEIFERLSASSVGVPLLSENYFNSGNCVHEAQQMVAQKDNGKMLLVPLKVSSDELTLPPWIENIQYLRLWEHKDDPELVVKAIVKRIDEQPKK